VDYLRGCVSGRDLLAATIKIVLINSKAAAGVSLSHRPVPLFWMKKSGETIFFMYELTQHLSTIIEIM
jgi:hypothetical protein